MPSEGWLGVGCDWPGAPESDGFDGFGDGLESPGFARSRLVRRLVGFRVGGFALGSLGVADRLAELAGLVADLLLIFGEPFCFVAAFGARLQAFFEADQPADFFEIRFDSLVL